MRARLTLLYNGGTGKYDIEQALAPDQQMWVDVAQLIRNQIPDANGQLLPPDLTSGTYELREVGNNGIGNLFEGKLIVDKTYGHAAYGCMVCCAPAHGFMGFDPFGILATNADAQFVQGIDNCTGLPDDMTGSYSTWWTGNTAIATASLNLIHGVAGGSTTNSARGVLTWGDGVDTRQCPTRTDTASGGVKIRLPYHSRLTSNLFSRPNVCPTHFAGWDRSIQEIVSDQFGQDFVRDGILITETVTVVPNGLNLPTSPQTGSEPTHNGGKFEDEFFFCSSVCGQGGSGETDATQVLGYGGIPVLSPNVIAMRCNGITWNAQ